MTKFETLFGIKESKIKNTCILMPLVNKTILLAFGIDKLNRGKLYSSINTNYFTLINTGIGPAFSGDAVLYLAETKCKNIILFGSCGLTNIRLTKSDKSDFVGWIDIGNLVSPIKCYAIESFSDLLSKKYNLRVVYPDKNLLKAFLKDNASSVKRVNCATLCSLKLEEENVKLFIQKNIDVVDMECSAMFSAANYSGLKAMALFYVTDIINKKPFYRPLSQKDQSSLSNSIKNAVDILCNFIHC